MKHTFRVHLTFLFCVTLFLCLAPSAAGLHVWGSCGNYSWDLEDDGLLTISGEGSIDDFQSDDSSWLKYKDQIKCVIINSGITRIGTGNFKFCSNLLSVEIPSSVTSIGDDAFCYCGLKSVEIPSNVTSIGQSAFRGVGFTKVTIPSSVESIGNFAFSCSSLQEIQVDPENNYFCSVNGVLFSKDKTAIICFPAGIEGDYSIPTSVTSIGEGAFCCCCLTSVTIPKSVKTIGKYAFWDSYRLTSMTIPEGVTDIGPYAFSGCSKLRNALIPSSVTKIESNVFNSCTSLTSVTIPAGVTDIGGQAFYACSSLTSIAIPAGVTDIGEAAFKSCSKLTDVTIPPNVTKISSRAFSDCHSLTNVIIPSSVTSIGEYAFAWCSNLTSVTIPTSVTRIMAYAFGYCDRLTDVFYGGANIDSIFIGSNNNYLLNATIHYNMYPDFILPASLSEIGAEAFRKGVFTCVKLSDSTEKIGAYAFADCKDLQYIFIPNKTADINLNAFGNLNGLTILGKSESTAEAFASAHNYTFVAIP